MSLQSLRRQAKELADTVDACTGARHLIRQRLDAEEQLDLVRLRIIEHETRVKKAEAAEAEPVEAEPADDPAMCCGTQREFIVTESLMVCRVCGLSQSVIPANLNGHGHDKITTDDSYTYRRENHFNEWMLCSQAKESTVVPESVMGACCEQIKKEGIATSRINVQIVRRILKNTGHRRYYENCAQIIQRLTGKSPLVFTPRQ